MVGASLPIAAAPLRSIARRVITSTEVMTEDLLIDWNHAMVDAIVAPDGSNARLSGAAT
jgi:hypothetical protein